MTEIAKPLVLIVDDVPTNIQILAEALKADYRIRIASRGEDALRLAQLEPQPDLVLLDIMLPGISGFEILEQIRKNTDTTLLPVVIFSNRDGADDKARAKSLGPNGFYIKAMTDLSDLIKSIENIVV